MGTFGLNEHLQPFNAPVSSFNTGGVASPFDFGENVSRNSITPIAIKNFNFSQGKGGTLTLGGSLQGSVNVNGYLSVDNAGGTEIVRVDTNGITVNNGSITVKNSAGSTSLDFLGVVSSQNFSNVNTSQAGGLNQAITGTVDTLLTSGSLSVITSRSINVLFLLNSASYMVQTPGTNTGNGVITMKVDGNEVERLVVSSGITAALSTSAHYLYTNLAAGTHPFTVTGRVDTLVGNGGTMTVYAYRMSYLLLGT